MLIYRLGKSSKKSKIARIVFKKPNGNLSVWTLNASLIKDSSELFEKLRSKIPDIKQDNTIFSDLLKENISTSDIQFKNLTLKEEGIFYLNESIPWNQVKVIDYEDFKSHISGYGIINITYQAQKDDLKNLQVAPNGTEQFRVFLEYLIKKAENASIDPTLLNLFDSSYRRKSNIFRYFVIFLGIVVLYVFLDFVCVIFFR